MPTIEWPLPSIPDYRPSYSGSQPEAERCRMSCGHDGRFEIVIDGREEGAAGWEALQPFAFTQGSSVSTGMVFCVLCAGIKAAQAKVKAIR
jgi:hypothetical protein